MPSCERRADASATFADLSATSPFAGDHRACRSRLVKGKLRPGLGGNYRLRPAPVGRKNVLAVKVGVARGDDIGAKNENRDRVMLNFAHVLYRVRPLASLGLGLSLVVAWGAIWYGLLTLLW